MEGRSTKTTTTCMPRLRGRRQTTAAAASPMSMLERFREVVLRIIMLSAVSKSPRTRQDGAEAAARRTHCCPDSYRSEAVEDCIEFLKRSAEGEGAKGSGIGEDDMEVSQTYMALPVI